MAEQEEDFSSLPLPDRFVHKVCGSSVQNVVKRADLANFGARIGKLGSKPMRMLQKHSKLPQMNQIQYSGRSC